MKRNLNIELLKLIACLMVVIIHVSANYVTNFAETSSYYQVGYFWNSITRVAVPIFVMISGSFILNSNRYHWKENTYKTWKTIINPTIMWTLIALVFLVVFENHSFAMIIGTMKSIVLGYAPYYHLWYMYMIIGIYLSVPLLLKVKNRLSFKQFIIITVIFMLVGWSWAWIEPLVGNVLPIKIEWFRCLQYLGYFMVGNVLVTWFGRMKRAKQKFVVIGLTTFVIGNLGVLIFGNNQPLSLFVILGSIGLFSAIVNLDVPLERVKSIHYAKYTFTIYLVHAFVLSLINQLISQFWNTPDVFNPLWYIPLMTIIVFSGSLIFAMAVERLNHKMFKN